MEYLKQFLVEQDEFFDHDQAVEELKDLHQRLKNVIEAYKSRGFREDSGDNTIVEQLKSAIKKFEAAKRGLGIVNKLSPGDKKKQHASRVMSNMNKLRSQVQNLENNLGG